MRRTSVPVAPERPFPAGAASEQLPRSGDPGPPAIGEELTGDELEQVAAGVVGVGRVVAEFVVAGGFAVASVLRHVP